MPGHMTGSLSRGHHDSGLPSYHQVVPHSDNEYASTPLVGSDYANAAGMHNRSYSPKGLRHAPNSGVSNGVIEDLQGGGNKCRTMSPRTHLERAYSPRAMSEPECPPPPRRQYKLVPLTDQEMDLIQQQRHLSDTEGAPLPPLRGMMGVNHHHNQPPSPAPNDCLLQDYQDYPGLVGGPMMDSACQSSLPSLVSESTGGTPGRTRLEMTPHGPQLVTRSDSPGSEEDPEYQVDSDMEHMELHANDGGSNKNSSGGSDRVPGKNNLHSLRKM